ncbi:hypothetical protein [Modestobacter marinus]|uniref:hypothetical protein n=1 Tax=Modestobacter marinus TaxID=477641 RepID=UPI001C96230D|nr:hypothetical protein [Modestobacter marinus]
MIELACGSARSSAGPDAYFARWVDHGTWPAWSPDTEWVRVAGPVRTGTRGVLKPRGGPRVRFVVSACRPGREYTDTSRLPGACLVFQHVAEESGAGTELGVRVTLSARWPRCGRGSWAAGSGGPPRPTWTAWSRSSRRRPEPPGSLRRRWRHDR